MLTLFISAKLLQKSRKLMAIFSIQFFLSDARRALSVQTDLVTVSGITTKFPFMYQVLSRWNCYMLSIILITDTMMPAF